MPNLKSILARFDIKSNKQQTNYNKLCKSLSNKDLVLVFESCFEQNIRNRLLELAKKDESCWSREIVTAIIDDSIFRQWLTNQEGLASFEECYGRFFSGQFGKVVSGCRIVCFGLSIDGVFYPLYLSHAGKGEKGKTKKVALELVERWSGFRRKFHREENLQLSYNISLSCDSGYSCMDLAHACVGGGLRYLSVPKKSHLFEIKGQKWKLRDYIEQVVLELEQEHLAAGKTTDFKYRCRGIYKSKNRDVALLFFRLNGSKKISVVYTTDIYSMAKTMRRHWFQRTYIEQFFRWLKHVLKIHHSITRTKEQFDLKLYRFAFIALHGQLIIRFIRKQNQRFRCLRMGFQLLQRRLTTEKRIIKLLKTYIL